MFFQFSARELSIQYHAVKPEAFRTEGNKAAKIELNLAMRRQQAKGPSAIKPIKTTIVIATTSYAA